MLSTATKKVYPVNINRKSTNYSTINVDNGLPSEPPYRGVPLRSSVNKKRCGVTVEYYHKADKARRLFRHHNCWSWSCPRCGPILKMEWINHLLSAVTKPTFTFHIGPGEWGDKYQQRMNRSRADYVRIEQDDGSFVVICTDSKQGAGVDNVQEFIQNAVNSATCNHKSMYTSVGWQKGKNGRFTTTGDWKFVGFVKATVESIVSTAIKLGVYAESAVGWDGVYITLSKQYLDNNGEGLAIFHRWLIWAGREEKVT